MRRVCISGKGTRRRAVTQFPPDTCDFNKRQKACLSICFCVVCVAEQERNKMTTFQDFGLSPALAKSLERMEYTTPTPIQKQAIPLALEGHDIMGSAQTGTGKTAAFAIPLVEKLLADPRGSALVLTPTRELGKQVMDIMHQLLGPKSAIKTAFIIGGEPMFKQLRQLRNRPRLIVGTPGRVNDHLERGNLMLDDAHFLVLDETDRMLDMGFTVQLEKIFKYMPEQRQTLMFSATLPKNILKMSDNYMNNPKRIAAGEVNVIAKNIKQEMIRIEQGSKYKELLAQLHEREGSVIVFVKTKHGADRMATNLRKDGFTADALHGDLRQSKRDKVMRNFRSQNFRVLIATDIAARGLDVPHIEHVVNYDLPQVAEDFIHRMGRTARAGAEGSAISFVASQDGRKWLAIERLLNPDAVTDFSDERREKSVKGRKGRGPQKGRGGSDRFKKQGRKDFKGGRSRDDRQGEGRKEFKGGRSRDERQGEGRKEFKGGRSRDDRQGEGRKEFKGGRSRDDRPGEGRKDFKGGRSRDDRQGEGRKEFKGGRSRDAKRSGMPASKKGKFQQKRSGAPKSSQPRKRAS